MHINIQQVFLILNHLVDMSCIIDIVDCQSNVLC